MLFDKNWFLKYQKILLWFCNTPLISIWFRWVLGINGNKSSIGKRKVLEIYPHAIRWFEKHKYSKRYGPLAVYSIEYRTHAKFAKRLYYAFKPVWYLIHRWDLLFANNFQPNWNFGFDTFGPAYPDPDPESTTTDGRVRRTPAEELFSAIRTGNGTSATDTEASDSAFTQLIAGTTSGKYNENSRSIFLFDTATLPDTSTISAAILSLWGTAKTNGLGDAALHIGAATPASNTSLTSGDYQTCGTISFGNIPYASFNAGGAYNAISFNASGIAAISLVGISKFSGQLSWDILNDTTGLVWSSGASSYHVGFFADHTGTSNDPKLVVTYTTGTAYTATFNDTITITDTFIRAVTKLLSDTITPTEVFLKTVNRIFSDTANLSEVFSKVHVNVRTLTDTITISEVFNKLKNGVNTAWTKVANNIGTWTKSGRNN